MKLDILDMKNNTEYWFHNHSIQRWFLFPILLHLLRGQKTASLFWKTLFFSPICFNLTIFLLLPPLVWLLKSRDCVSGRYLRLMLLVVGSDKPYAESETVRFEFLVVFLLVHGFLFLSFSCFFPSSIKSTSLPYILPLQLFFFCRWDSIFFHQFALIWPYFFYFPP